MDRYDPYTRVARRHLSTRAARAVYLLLVGGSPGQSWSAAQAARHTRQPSTEVAAILVAFEAAGIAERSEQAAMPARYRWRQNIDHLEGERVCASS